MVRRPPNRSSSFPVTAKLYSATALLYYGHPDHLGSTRFASTPSRTMYFDGAYAPFGEPYAQSRTPTHPSPASARTPSPASTIFPPANTAIRAAGLPPTPPASPPSIPPAPNPGTAMLML